MKRAILVIYRNPWGDTGTRRITVVQFQDARVAPVISERGREGAEQRARLSLARCSWARKAGVNPEYEAFSSVSAGNSAVAAAKNVVNDTRVEREGEIEGKGKPWWQRYNVDLALVITDGMHICSTGRFITSTLRNPFVESFARPISSKFVTIFLGYFSFSSNERVVPSWRGNGRKDEIGEKWLVK